MGLSKVDVPIYKLCAAGKKYRDRTIASVVVLSSAQSITEK